MTQGITNSLNMTLMRMNAIENSFSALERISNQLNNMNSSSAVNNADFKAVLDDKTKEVEERNKIIDELVEESPIDVQTKVDSDSNSANENKDNISQKKIDRIKDAINTKSKIDLQAQAANVEELIESFSNQYNVDSDFIKAIIKQESGFNTKATSPKGAMGLMQLMPATAESMGVTDAYNPSQNIEGGVKYLKGLLDRFDNNKELALAAYNAGPTAVKKYGGIPPYKETQNYVNSIMSAYEQMKNFQTIDGGTL